MPNLSLEHISSQRFSLDYFLHRYNPTERISVKRTNPQKLRFQPYVSRFPGQSQITLKSVDGKNERKVRFSYPEPSIQNRTDKSDIKLEGIEQELVEQAHEVVNEIKKDMGKSETISLKLFLDIYKRKVEELIRSRKLPPELDNIRDFESLVTFLSIRTELNKEGFLRKFPNDFLEFNTDGFMGKIQTIGRAFLVNLRGLKSAKEVEEMTNWTAAFADAGLRNVSRYLSNSDFLKIVFPGHLEGANPLIRGWMVQGAKWNGDREDVYDLLSQASKYAVSRELKITDGHFDPSEAEVIDWGDTFSRRDIRLGSALDNCPYLESYLDILQIAIPDFFQSVPRHRFASPGKWQGENRFKTIDSITKHLVENKLKLLDEKGNLIPERLRMVSDWFNQYDSECSGCLKSSGIANAYEALRRVYPDSFGWGEGKINPSDIKYDGMWEGKSGEKLYRLKLSHSIYLIFQKLKDLRVSGFEEHEVRFDPNKEPPLKITKKDFLRLKNFYIEHGINWDKHFKSFGLEAGHKAVAGSVQRGFEIILGKFNERTKEFGRSGITLEDVASRRSQKQNILFSLTSATPNQIETITIKTDTEGRYLNGKTGIEGSPISYIGKENPTTIEELKTKALYAAFAASIGSDQTQKQTALERMITSTKDGGFLLSDENLVILLRIIKDDVINNTNLNERNKLKLKITLEQLLSSPTPFKDTRPALFTAYVINNSIHKNDEDAIRIEDDLLSLLNALIESTIELISIHEIRRTRNQQDFSEHYRTYFENLEVEDA